MRKQLTGLHFTIARHSYGTRLKMADLMLKRRTALHILLPLLICALVFLNLDLKNYPLNQVGSPGDIVWKTGHCEMVYSGRRTMGAHTDGVALVDQVSISDGDVSPSYYEEVYRYGKTVDATWIIGGTSEYFGRDKMENNAICIFNYFYSKGWTKNAIAALCGNIQQESTFNPALIEIGGTGHGLVQWTPPENLYDVLDVLYGSHSDWTSGEKQCNVIYAEFEEAAGLANRGIEKQWYSTTAYPMSWMEWATSTEDAGTLALAFQANYERPASLHSERAGYAREWLEFFKDFEGGGGSEPSEPSEPSKIKKKKGYNFVLFNRQRKWRYGTR